MWELKSADGHHAIGVSDRTVICIWRGITAIPAIKAFEKFQQAHAARTPGGQHLIQIIEATSALNIENSVASDILRNDITELRAEYLRRVP